MNDALQVVVIRFNSNGAGKLRVGNSNKVCRTQGSGGNVPSESVFIDNRREVLNVGSVKL